MTNENSTMNSLGLEITSLKYVLDEIGAYIFMKDLNGCYTFANSLVLELFDLPLEQVIGKNDEHFFNLSRSKELRLNDHRVLGYGEIIEKEELNIIKATGETKIYWTVKKPLRNAGNEIIGLCGISTDITERKQIEKERENLIERLEDALSEIKTLQGIIPICSYCHSIRDDEGKWNRLEAYLSNHSDARFSHSICPNCEPKIRSEYGLDDKQEHNE